MAKYTVKIDKELCKGCHLCIHYCRFDVLKAEDEVNSHGYLASSAAAPQQCTGCGCCFLVCPDSVIEIKEDAGEGIKE